MLNETAHRAAPVTGSFWEDRPVDDQAQRRVAANEAALREGNEAIERGEGPGEEGERGGVRCEGAPLGGDQGIDVTIAEDEQVRAHPRRVVLAPGHPGPAEDTLVLSR